MACYGLSKKCAEKLLIDSYNKLNKLKTINIFRAFSFGGSHFNYDNHFAFDRFIKNRINSEDIYLLSDGSVIRNYMHPLDLSCWILISKKFNKINLLNTGVDKNYTIKSLAKRIAKIKFYDLPPIRVKTTNNNNSNENYTPNINFAKKMGLKAKISLDMQIKDSLNYYYEKNTEYKKVVAFDLDGTLIDSAPDITEALNYVLGLNGLKSVKVKEVKNLIGNGARALIDDSFKKQGCLIKDMDNSIASFLFKYKSCFKDKTILYPNTKTILQNLKKKVMKLY